MPRRKSYIIQKHTGLLLLGFGAMALLFPPTRTIMQLPPIMEWILFVANLLVGLALLGCRSRRWLDRLLLMAVACCAGNAIGYTVSIGPNTASWVYAVEVYFIIRLLGRVRADRERAADAD